jgi:hypothetical protein
MLRLPPLCLLLVLLAGPASAGTFVGLAADPFLSQIEFPGPPPDVRVLTGTIGLELGALPPLGSTTTFDVRSITLAATGLTISVDPDVANPGAGVLNPAGQFLIPNLFLRIDDGSFTDLALANVTGTFFAQGASCPYTYCLETSFEIDGGASLGLISVALVAIPEPSTALCAAAGLTLLALHARRRGAHR